VDSSALSRLLGEAGAALGDSLRFDPAGESYADVTSERLLAVVEALMGVDGFHHLSAITGQDRGDALELLYHFWCGGGLTLRVRCPREGATLPSLMALLPGADWYEREIHEMLGVDFGGRPPLEPLLLPDDWEEAPPLLAADERGGER